ncbi:MAG: NHL repeat-containing protein, partial [Pyrinomonadaceae bacterium]
AITAIQAIVFQVWFSASAGTRGIEYNAAYESILDRALEEGTVPIYLDEGSEPAYIHAFWYGVQKKLDLPTTFVHLLDNEHPPYGALVISSDSGCKDCEMIATQGSFILYRKKRPNAAEVTTTKPVPVSPEMPPGMVVRPRGFTVDKDGNRFVADTDNARIQKFDAGGRFVMRFVTGKEEMLEPHGVAVDQAGNIYVTDSFRHRLLKFNPDGTYKKEFTGPEVGFYGPRDIAADSASGKLYIVDQGRTRIVVFDPSNENFTFFGNPGSGPGQLKEPTGVDVAGGFVYVADTGNDRVQVFDLGGTYVRQWPIPQWQKNIQTFPDVAFDTVASRLYVSNGSAGEILVFD